MQLTQWPLLQRLALGCGVWVPSRHTQEAHPGGEESLAKAIYKDWCSSQGLQLEWLCLGLQGKGVTREGDTLSPLSSHCQGFRGDRSKTQSLSHPGNFSIKAEEKDIFL